MFIKLTSLVALLAAVMPTSAYSHGNLTEDLGGTAGATDIILFKCSAQVGIDRAQASVRDVNPANATPNLNVQIANAASADPVTGCNGVTYSAVKTTTGEGTWSPFTADITVSANSYYCVKVTKTGAAAENYTVDHHCGIPANPAAVPPTAAYFGHQASTLVSKILDQ